MSDELAREIMAKEEARRKVRAMRPRRFRCREGCGNIVEEKDGICPGCDAYRDHTGHF